MVGCKPTVKTHNPQIKFYDSLPICNINHTYGDEYIISEGMTISKENDKYFAQLINPYDTFTLMPHIEWKAQLNQQNIYELIQFINNAKKIEHKIRLKQLDSNDLKRYTTSTENYYLGIPNDTIRISSHINWPILNYFEIRDTIFKNQYLKLEQQRKSIIDIIKRMVIGSWYVNEQKNAVRGNDSIILTKMKSKGLCNWVFYKDYKFKSNCTSEFNFTYSEGFRISTYKDKIFLEIDSGYLNGNMLDRLVNIGESFEIVQIRNEKIVLKSAYR